jgi:hypothetical protein
MPGGVIDAFVLSSLQKKTEWNAFSTAQGDDTTAPTSWRASLLPRHAALRPGISGVEQLRMLKVGIGTVPGLLV